MSTFTHFTENSRNVKVSWPYWLVLVNKASSGTLTYVFIFPEWTQCKIIKVLAALVGRLSLSLGWEHGPKRGLKLISLNPKLAFIEANSADPDQTSRSNCGV